MLIIGNTIALIASLLMVYSGIIKNKKKILYVQSIQIGLYVISNIVLGGITGAIINALSFIRNILCYNDKFGLIEKSIITILSIVLSILFNDLGIIGLLPLISTVLYIWLMNIKSVIKFKYLIIFTMILWYYYDLTIKSYTSAIFDVITMFTNLFSIYQIYLKKEVVKWNIYLKVIMDESIINLIYIKREED